MVASIYAADAVVQRVADVNRAVGDDADAVRAIELRFRCRAAVAIKPLGPVADDGSERAGFQIEPPHSMVAHFRDEERPPPA